MKITEHKLGDDPLADWLAIIFSPAVSMAKKRIAEVCQQSTDDLRMTIVLRSAALPNGAFVFTDDRMQQALPALARVAELEREAELAAGLDQELSR